MAGEAVLIGWPAAVSLIGGYLLGAIPFGLLLTRMAGLGDIRAVGSGNIGATNVLRTGNRPLAAATLLLDGGKGAAAVLIAGSVAPLYGLLAGGAAFLGHLYPAWLRFVGGKGVATFLGIMLAAAWPVGLACCATWLVVAVVARLSSLSALAAAALCPVYAYVLVGPGVTALAVGLAVFIFIRHKANIGRLLRGEEPRIGASK